MNVQTLDILSREPWIILTGSFVMVLPAVCKGLAFMTEPEYANVSVHINSQTGQRTDGFAVTGFVLGLIGALFSWIPIIGTIAWFLVIPGGLFSAIGISRKISPGLSVAGLVISILGFLACMACVALLAAVSTAVR